MSPNESLSVFMRFYGSLKVYICPYVSLCVLMGLASPYAFLWILVGCYGYL